MSFEGVPSSLWYRIFLGELMPEVDRVLYLDADTIAVDSLAPLWATELGTTTWARSPTSSCASTRAGPSASGWPGPRSTSTPG